MQRETSIGGSQSGNEMVSEGADGTFSCIALVAVVWHKLEVCVLVLHAFFKNIGTFVVESLETGLQACLDKDSMCFGVC